MWVVLVAFQAFIVSWRKQTHREVFNVFVKVQRGPAVYRVSNTSRDTAYEYVLGLLFDCVPVICVCWLN